MNTPTHIVSLLSSDKLPNLNKKRLFNAILITILLVKKEGNTTKC